MCKIDGGWPSGIGLQWRVPNHPMRLWSKAKVVSNCGKVGVKAGRCKYSCQGNQVGADGGQVQPFALSYFPQAIFRFE